MEKRILFRLLSGLHSSIMTQIANDYRFDGKTSRRKGEGAERGGGSGREEWREGGERG